MRVPDLRSRRALLLGLGVIVAAAVLAAAVVIGRHEDRKNASVQNAGMARLWAEVGSRLHSRTLDGWRLEFSFDCLLYRRGKNPFAFELCFDRTGRLIEAIDRRAGYFHAWSLRYEHQAAAIRVDYGEVHRLLAMMGAYSPTVSGAVGYRWVRKPPPAPPKSGKPSGQP